SLPPKLDLKYMQRPGQYPIPNDYQIEAFWELVSQISPSDASSKYCNVRYSGKNIAISEILIFGLQLYEELTKAEPKKNKPRLIKPLSDLSNSLHRKKIRKASESLFNDFEKKKNFWHPADNPKLKELVLEASKQPWLIKFKEDRQSFDNCFTGFAKRMASYDSDSKSDLNSKSDSDSGSDLDSEVIAAILEKGAYCNICAILRFIIPNLVTNKVLIAKTDKFTDLVELTKGTQDKLTSMLPEETWCPLKSLIISQAQSTINSASKAETELSLVI
ncbi:14367_t:CDS:2, partial [Dentiscutata heterogama]